MICEEKPIIRLNHTEIEIEIDREIIIQTKIEKGSSQIEIIRLEICSG